MKKKFVKGFYSPDWGKICKLWIIMRLTVFLILLSLFDVSASVYSQNTKLNLSLKNVSLEQVFKSIQEQSDFDFFYQNEQIPSAANVSVQSKDESVESILENVLKGTGLKYYVLDKDIVISSKALSFANLSEQQRRVTGKVTDSSGSPIPGVSVVVKGSTNGVISDNNGNYSISNIPESATLQFSFLGMKAQEIKVGNQLVINVVMTEETFEIEEVVAVGYGTQKKANLTGSVISIDSKKLENRGVANISNILAGQVPGVTVLQRGGSPGRDEGTINIRGIGTLGNSNPLIVIDGIPSTDYSYLNPNDIESISVLKDAASASIYGVNAANGVMVITTKRGTKQKLMVDYNFQLGTSDIANLPKKVNSYQLALLYNEACSNDGSPLKFSSSDLQKFKDGSDPAYANSDWVKASFPKNGAWMSHNLSLSGGSDDTKYNISLGYLNQDGLMQNTGYKRYTFRANFDQKISERLNVGFNFSLSNRDVTDPATNQGVGGETWYLNQVFRSWSNDPIQYADGRYAYPLWSGQNYNPVAYTSKAAGNSVNNDTRLVGTGFAEFKILEGLKIKGIFTNTRDFNYSTNIGLGMDLYSIDPATGTINSTPQNNASMPAVPALRNISKGFYRNNDINLQALLTYEKTFKRHQFKALLGTESRNKTDESEGISRTNVSDPSLTGLNAADPTGQNTYGSKVVYKSQSFFGRLNYMYNDKYLLEANLRNDGTSHFALEKRSALFPSFSAGWIISNEKFFNAPAIYNLKLRASWGVLGNEQIGNYQYLSTYNIGSFYVFDGSRYTGANEGVLANEIISWESTTAKNIGTDIGFLKNKLTVSADFFIRDTKDILLNLSTPAVLGATPPVQNAGAVKNTGFEIIANYKNRINKKAGYYVSASLSKVKNEITDLAGTQYPGRQLGDPINNIYGYVAEGLFQNQDQITAHADQTGLGGIPKLGDVIYKDLNGDSKIDANDRKNLGSTFPSVNYGFSFGVDYDGFDMSMVWQGVADVQGLLEGRLSQAFWDGASPITDQLNRWTADGLNPKSFYPRTSFSASYNYLPSSKWIVNTDYLKLRNIQIGYTLHSPVLQKLKISKLRAFVSGENLITLSPCKIIDPESLTTGDPFFGFSGTKAYPTSKRYLAGISLTF
jgi:TonB-linked SusC/RagA family outer membrane protein